MAMILDGQIIICCALVSLILLPATLAVSHAVQQQCDISPSLTTGGKHYIVVVVVVVLPAAFSNTPSAPSTPLSSGRL